MLNRWWRRAPSPAVDAALWRQVVNRHRRLLRLSAEQQETLRQLSGRFLAEKTFSVTHDFQLSPLRAALLASVACLPVLHLGFDWLQGWRELIIYPGQFRVRRHELDEHGVAHEWDDELAGEAWEQGPVVLSWADVLSDLRRPQPGFDVVIHEIAHKIDASDGAIDGVPRLPRSQREQWIAVMQAAFDQLNAELDGGRAAPIDDYAAESPEEFFAVCSEYHFTAPQQLSDALPAVAEQLTGFYGPSPLAGD